METSAQIFAVFAAVMSLVLIAGRRFTPNAHAIGFYATLVAIGTAFIMFLVGR